MVMKKTTGLTARTMVETNQISDLQSSAALRAATWVGGQPLAYTANGYTAVTVNAGTGADDFFAIAYDGWDAYNDPSLGGAMKVEGVNISSNNQIMTLKGQFRAVLAGESVNGVMTYSFSRTPTSGNWAIGDIVYISAAGVWDNTAVNTGSVAYGQVMAITGNPALADALEIAFESKILA